MGGGPYEDTEQERPTERASVKERSATSCCLCGFGSRRACCLCCWSTFLLVAAFLAFILWPRALLPPRFPAGERPSLYTFQPACAALDSLTLTN
jgi:hypothetical protein